MVRYIEKRWLKCLNKPCFWPINLLPAADTDTDSAEPLSTHSRQAHSPHIQTAEVKTITSTTREAQEQT